MTLIDGRAIARRLRAQVGEEVAALAARGVAPVLAIMAATADPAAVQYAAAIARAAGRLGIDARRVGSAGDGRDEVLALLDDLSADPAVHGIICQTPLPEGLTLADAGAHVAPAKDVDGANPVNLGRLAVGLPARAPATALAVMEILRAQGVRLAGARAVVVGRSAVVGKPLALLLLAADATVTVAHSRSLPLADHTRQADVLVVAAGRAGLIGPEHVKRGAIVVDVGTNATPSEGLVGDVRTAEVEPVAAAITPVPGGVGPVTTAQLLRNVATAAAGGRS